MIVNEVLTYAIFSNNANNNDDCKKVMLSFYDENEIKSAKRSLWMECKKDINKEHHNRIDSPGRTAAAANIDDIMEAIKRLDAKGKLPDVVARDIGRLPDRQPEQLNMLYVIDEVADLKKAKITTQDTLSDMKIAIMKLQDDARKKCYIDKSNVDINPNIAGNSNKEDNTSLNAEQDTSETSESSEVSKTSKNVSSHQKTSECLSMKQPPNVEGKRWGPERRSTKPINSMQISQTSQPEQQINGNPIPVLNSQDATPLQGQQNQQTTGVGT